MLPHMTNAVILAYELTSAHVTRVRPAIVVGAHVRVVVHFVDVRFDAEFALERFRRARRMRPLVQLQIPLGTKAARALGTRERFHIFVNLHVRVQRRLQITDIAHRTLDHIHFLLGHPFGDVRFVVPLTHVPGQAACVHETFDAEWALFRLFVVNLLMPQQLHLTVEHFAAVADEIFQFTFLIQVQVLFMLQIVGIAFKLAVAEFALDWILTGMHVHVFQQLLLGDERFITVVTGVRFDFHVTFLMQHIAGSGMELFTARHTLVRMHLLYVLLVFVDGSEAYEARRANAASFSYTVQYLQMLE